MDDTPASLLTKKQRDRIEDGFADLSGQQRRRDQQRIRARFRAGLLDFEELRAYPDRQLALAVEDLPEDDLRSALADATVVLERTRAIADLDRSAVLRAAQTRAAETASEGEDLRSLEAVDLRTPAEIRLDAEADLRERLEPNPWERRADRLLRLAGSTAIPLFAVLLLDAVLPANLIATSTTLAAVVYLFGALVGGGLAGVFLIKAAQTLKYDLLPVGRALRRDPTAGLRFVSERLRRPIDTIRRVWDEL